MNQVKSRTMPFFKRKYSVTRKYAPKRQSKVALAVKRTKRKVGVRKSRLLRFVPTSRLGMTHRQRRFVKRLGNVPQGGKNPPKLVKRAAALAAKILQSGYQPASYVRGLRGSLPVSRARGGYVPGAFHKAFSGVGDDVLARYYQKQFNVEYSRAQLAAARAPAVRWV